MNLVTHLCRATAEIIGQGPFWFQRGGEWGLITPNISANDCGGAIIC